MRYLSLLASSITMAFTAVVVHAAEAPNPGLENVRAQYDFQDPLGGVSVPELIGNLITQVLPIVGALFLVLFIWSGVLWMTAGGEADKVKKAIKTMQNAVIGMAIVMGAYFIVSALLTAGANLAGSSGTGTP